MKSSIKSVIIAAGILLVAAHPCFCDELSDLRTRVGQCEVKLKDMRATVVVTQTNRRELQKLGRGFAESYQIQTADIRFKSPDKFRVSGRLGMATVDVLTVGNAQTVRIPSIGMKKHEDITNEPLRQMLSLDFGVISDRTWDIYKVKLARTENNDNGKSYVLMLSATGSKKTQLIWVDAVTLKVLRRDKLMDDGSIGVKIVYSDHKEYEGVWIPTKAEVYNSDGKLAAATETRNIAVNGGLSDKEFE